MSLTPSLLDRHRASRPLVSLVAAALAATALAGCGSSGTSSASDGATSPSSAPSSSSVSDSTPSPSTVPSPTPVPSPVGVRPACSEIWVAGKTLPFRYTGCAEGGTDVPSNAIKCELGQQLVAYKDTFWAVRDHPIKKVASVRTDPGYLAAQKSCTS